MKPRISMLRDRMPWMWLHWQCVSGEGWRERKGYGKTPAEAFEMWSRGGFFSGPTYVDSITCRLL